MRVCLLEGRGLRLPHPLYLLQPLLILSQLSHERLVPEPSLVQLVAVFPSAIASHQHFLMDPAIQLCRAEKGAQEVPLPSCHSLTTPLKRIPRAGSQLRRVGLRREIYANKTDWSGPSGPFLVKDAYVVPQYQILGLCQPRLHTRNQSVCLVPPPSFRCLNLCSPTNLQPKFHAQQNRDPGMVGQLSG